MLDPRSLGVSDMWLSIDEYKIRVRKQLENLPLLLKNYCIAVFDFISGNTTLDDFLLIVKDTELIKEFKVNKKRILKEFGEVLGPIWVAESFSDKSEIKIFHPLKQNHPLFDYIIEIDKVGHKISAKMSA